MKKITASVETYRSFGSLVKLFIKSSIHQFSAKRHPFIWTILQQKANYHSKIYIHR